jgi:hypothetical protein
MRTVSVFRNNQNQAIRLPKEFEFQGVTELTIEKTRRHHSSAARPAELELFRGRTAG